MATNGLKFLYHVTLGRREVEFCIPQAKRPQRLPEILSREEIERLLAAASEPKHRTLLMLTYSAGLRVSEVAHLKVRDIDSGRMSLRVEQGKGNKDRYTVLSGRMLKELRTYWRAYRPEVWLFTGRNRSRPMHVKKLSSPSMLSEPESHLHNSTPNDVSSGRTSSPNPRLVCERPHWPGLMDGACTSIVRERLRTMESPKYQKLSGSPSIEQTRAMRSKRE